MFVHPVPGPRRNERAGLKILDEGDKPPRYDFPDLGAIAFRMEPGFSTSRQVSPRDPLVEMQLVDAARLTWTQTIPFGALEVMHTLKMIALADLQSDSVPGLDAHTLRLRTASIAGYSIAIKCENRGRWPRFPFEGGEEKSPVCSYCIIMGKSVLDSRPMIAPRPVDSPRLVMSSASETSWCIKSGGGRPP